MVSCDITNAILEKSVKFELKVVEIIILWTSRQLLNNNNNNNNNINYMLQNLRIIQKLVFLVKFHKNT